MDPPHPNRTVVDRTLHIAIPQRRPTAPPVEGRECLPPARLPTIASPGSLHPTAARAKHGACLVTPPCDQSTPCRGCVPHTTPAVMPAPAPAQCVRGGRPSAKWGGHAMPPPALVPLVDVTPSAFRQPYDSTRSHPTGATRPYLNVALQENIFPRAHAQLHLDHLLHSADTVLRHQRHPKVTAIPLNDNPHVALLAAVRAHLRCCSLCTRVTKSASPWRQLASRREPGGSASPPAPVRTSHTHGAPADTTSQRAPGRSSATTSSRATRPASASTTSTPTQHGDPRAPRARGGGTPPLLEPKHYGSSSLAEQALSQKA